MLAAERTLGSPGRRWPVALPGGRDLVAHDEEITTGVVGARDLIWLP